MAVQQLTEEQVRKVVAAKINEKYGSQAAFAAKMEHARSHVSAFLSGVKLIPDWVLKKFGIKKTVQTVYEAETAALLKKPVAKK